MTKTEERWGILRNYCQYIGNKFGQEGETNDVGENIFLKTKFIILGMIGKLIVR